MSEAQDGRSAPGSGGSPERSAAEAGTHGFRDLGLGLVLLGSAAVLRYSAATDADMHQNFGLDPGPAFLPDILLWMLGIGALILVFQGIVRLAWAGWRVERPLVDIRRLFVPLLMAISIILYVLLVPTIGFLVASLLFSVVWSLGLTIQDHRFAMQPLLVSAAGSLVLAVAIYLTFKQLIGIPLG